MNLILLLFLHSRPPKRRQLTFGCLLSTFYLSLDYLKKICLPTFAFLTSWKKSNTLLARLSGEPRLLKCPSKRVRTSRTSLSISASSWYVCCWSASLWCFCDKLSPPQTCTMPTQLRTWPSTTREAVPPPSCWNTVTTKSETEGSQCDHRLDLVNFTTTKCAQCSCPFPQCGHKCLS